MPPPFSLDAEGKNDVTKWPRGTTFPAPVLIERNEGFTGDIVLEMAARQGRHRQGIRGPELSVQPGIDRILYPVFLPEWLETTRTSRMVVNGVSQVADPQGRVRYLSSKLKTRPVRNGSRRRPVLRDSAFDQPRQGADRASDN
jgi:hypothetical protein